MTAPVSPATAPHRVFLSALPVSYCRSDMRHLRELLEHQPLGAEFTRVWQRHAPGGRVGMDENAAITFYQQGPYTICRLTLFGFNNDVFGVAKQCRYAPRADEYAPERGALIAFSRACQNAGIELARRERAEALAILGGHAGLRCDGRTP